MNKLIEKLINDGSEKRRKRMNRISYFIGSSILAMGLLCMIIKFYGSQNVTEAEVHHEDFSIVAISLFTCCGFLIILNTMAVSSKHSKRDPYEHI
jgi:predicted membrane channel-forming protein YqfA (hemolysin III family)